MTEQDKVTVDDIIGIVKTEEQTNSVEEVRKLRGRGNETAKRFKLGYVCGDFGLIDNNEWIDLHSMSENSEKNVQICINKMNELAEGNEQLKTTIQQLRTDNTKQKKLLNTTMKENEQLKEHQRTLEAKIVRLKDRVKTFEKHYSLKDIERYKKMDNCNCIDSRRLEK